MSAPKIKLAILLAACLSGNTLYAQDSLKSSIELGINLFSLTPNSIPSVNSGGPEFNPNFFNGIFFKIHFADISLRVSADHADYLKKINASDTEQDTISSSNHYTSTTVSAGFEKTLKRMRGKVFQFYYGGDLSLCTGHLNSTNTGVSGITQFTSEKFQTGIGVSPFAGIRLIARKFFVVSYEASFTALIGQEKESRTFTSPKTAETNTISFIFDGRPAPVSRLSVSFRIPVQKQVKKV